jgi:LCP family protein required for cell wall assembly
MIVRVDPKAHHALLVSVPRDLWAAIPGHGHQKINAAYNAGAQAMVSTVERNFGLPVNHYLEVNFESFRGIVDAVGGVHVTFDAPTYDICTGLHIHSAGTYRLNGEDALAYVRARHYYVVRNGRWVLADAIPDLGRIKRQQAFMREVASEAVRKSLNSPIRALRVVDALLPKLRADRRFGRAQVFQLLTVFQHVDPNDPRSIEMVTLDTQGGPRQQGADVLYLAPTAAGQLARLRSQPTTAPSAGASSTSGHPGAGASVTRRAAPPTTAAAGSRPVARPVVPVVEPPLPRQKCR